MRIRVVRLPSGLWQASIDGEKGRPEVDADPDHALLILIRRNLHRLGIESISYECTLPPSVGDAPAEDDEERGEGVSEAERPDTPSPPNGNPPSGRRIA